MSDDELMGLAIDEAHAATAREPADVPIGAVVLGPDGAVLAAAGNRREADEDPTAHAEILALRRAAEASGRWNLSGCTLAVTLEPCTMCAGAIVLARIQRLVVDRKSTRLNSSHVAISYAVFCLKKKKHQKTRTQ